MKTQSAIKKLEKHARSIIQSNEREYIAYFKAAKVRLYVSGDKVIMIYVIKNDQYDDLIEDYCGGHFVKTIKAAIELAIRMELM